MEFANLYSFEKKLLWLFFMTKIKIYCFLRSLFLFETSINFNQKLAFSSNIFVEKNVTPLARELFLAKTRILKHILQ